jgi:hypothetical protein
MGLDGVELVLAVEDAFQIHILDEVSDVLTVGELHDLVVSKMPGQDSKCCLTSAAFYRTRRGIVETLGVDRRTIRPAKKLHQTQALWTICESIESKGNVAPVCIPKTGRRRQ